jgi:hypothetical protein
MFYSLVSLTGTLISSSLQVGGAKLPWAMWNAVRGGKCRDSGSQMHVLLTVTTTSVHIWVAKRESHGHRRHGPPSTTYHVHRKWRTDSGWNMRIPEMVRDSNTNTIMFLKLSVPQFPHFHYCLWFEAHVKVKPAWTHRVQSSSPGHTVHSGTETHW